MFIVEPSAKVLMVNPSGSDSHYILKFIEECGRTCYKSHDKITESSSVLFVKNLITRGHLSVLEHASMTVKFVCDRGVSHEIVRHRLVSYCQESTRYCDYSKKGVTFVKPCFLPDCPVDQIRRNDYLCMNTNNINSKTLAWLGLMLESESQYTYLLSEGLKPQEARCVLPNSLKTELVMTTNLWEWRLFFEVRAEGTTGTPHPQMAELTVPLIKEVKSLIPVVFDDILKQEPGT